MIANKSHKLFRLVLILTLNKQASSERRIYEKNYWGDSTGSDSRPSVNFKRS